MKSGARLSFTSPIYTVQSANIRDFANFLESQLSQIYPFISSFIALPTLLTFHLTMLERAYSLLIQIHMVRSLLTHVKTNAAQTDQHSSLHSAHPRVRIIRGPKDGAPSDEACNQ